MTAAAAAAAAGVRPPYVEEPKELEAWFAAKVAGERARLVSFLSAKTRGDLEHAMAAVLADFDAKTRSDNDANCLAQALLFRNRAAAASFHRALRMRLAADYRDFIEDSVKQASPVSSSPSPSSPSPSPSSSSLSLDPPLQLSPRQRFDGIVARYRELAAAFVEGAGGSSLAWQPFLHLQEDLRMEQLGARERIFRGELRAGRALPPISDIAKDPEALADLLLGTEVPVPSSWLAALLK